MENKEDKFFGIKIARKLNSLKNRPNNIFFISHSSITAFRSHQAYVVNLENVIGIDKKIESYL